MAGNPRAFFKYTYKGYSFKVANLRKIILNLNSDLKVGNLPLFIHQNFEFDPGSSLQFLHLLLPIYTDNSTANFLWDQSHVKENLPLCLISPVNVPHLYQCRNDKYCTRKHRRNRNEDLYYYQGQLPKWIDPALHLLPQPVRGLPAKI